MKFQTLSATRNRTNTPLISDLHRAAFAAWLLMNLLLVVVPRYGAYAMTCTGILMVLSATVYHCMLPKVPLMIRFESNKVLSFHFGWCFYLVIAAGEFGGNSPKWMVRLSKYFFSTTSVFVGGGLLWLRNAIYYHCVSKSSIGTYLLRWWLPMLHRYVWMVVAERRIFFYC